jgi:aquaporin Z
MYTKYLVEFLGTLLLTYTVFASKNWLFIGLALAVAVFLGGKVSGGAFNPAVAFSFFYSGQLSANDFMFYTISEILGAWAGFEIFKRL